MENGGEKIGGMWGGSGGPTGLRGIEGRDLVISYGGNDLLR